MHSWLQRMAVPQRLFFWLVAGALLSALCASFAFALQYEERSAKLHLKERFRMRADIGEAFLSAYVKELLVRERRIAELELSDVQVPDRVFKTVASSYAFEAAVATDATGKLLQVHPTTPQLHGSDIAPRYQHLRVALAQGSAVSGVVPSAAAGAPVVAFATRYHTAHGPRVFSGAYDVRTTPLTAYLNNFIGIPSANGDLVDGSGFIIASSRKLTPFVSRLDDVDPMLARAVSQGADDEYGSGRAAKLFYTRKVGGTPWSLIISVGHRALYAPLDGSRRWLQWSLFGAFCVASSIAMWLLLRLRAANKLSSYLARVDSLTALPNRLQLEEHLARLMSAAARHKRPLSIFIVDLDHFKRINDSYGHVVGDEVLRTLAGRMAAALRAEDMLGRWGGEEFLALLPSTAAEGAGVVANRVRTLASNTPIQTSTGVTIHVTVSIGCATRLDARDTRFIERADEALYDAKRQGRDRVVTSSPPAALPDLEQPALQ